MESGISLLPIPGTSKSKIIKWKVSVGTKVDRGSIVLLYENSHSDSPERLKAGFTGTVKRLLKEEGEWVPPR